MSHVLLNVTRCACGMHFDGVLAFLQYFAKAMQTKYGESNIIILSSDHSSKVQVKIRSKVRGLLSDISFEQDASSLNFRHEVKIRGGKRLFDQ